LKTYILRRLFTGVITITMVFSINFILMHLAPGDPVTIIMGKDNQDPVLRKALMEKYSLDKPLPVQYVIYLKQVIQGDLGESIIYHRPVIDMIAEKSIPTIVLVLTGAILSLVLGTWMGIRAAQKEGSLLDVIFSGISYIFNATPSFWLGLMMIILFASILHLVPSSGMTNARNSYTGFRYLLDVAYHMILPVMVLVLLDIPLYFRIAKSSVLQAASEDFVMTLRATGMDEKKIFNKYIFRNAILPTITVFGISLAFLITGVALIEIVFAWPGMGRLVLTAITQRDYPTLMGIYLLMSISIAITMIITDIVYAVADPRIRYQ
jgi:peptide/nickel transport system permease protein